MSPRRSASSMGCNWLRTSPGPYDVIARLQVPSLDELGRLVASRIQLLDGVTRTVTCMVLHR
jgi:DNA-binding Lrp family transcriptional regulator